MTFPTKFILLYNVLTVMYFHEAVQGVPHGISDNVNSKAGSLFDEPEVFLTVSSKAGYEGTGENAKLFDKRLELNWNNFVVEEGDFVGLYDYDISLHKPSSADLMDASIQLVPVNASKGYHKTETKYDSSNLTDTKIAGERCMGYWIAYINVKNNTYVVRKINCLRIYPTWMTDMRDIIGDTPLHSLMIPGTHDAGAWRRYAGLPSENIIINYYICQEEPIYDQLVHGIRYLDVRVAHYPATDEKFWVNHDTFRVGPLIDLINDVKRFTAETNEIVFMDFHRFPVGFSSAQVHEELVEFVRINIGDYLAPKALTKNVTPNQLWSINKTVILTYAEDSVSSQHDILWPYLIHEWGDKNKVDDLKNYFEVAIPRRGCTGTFWSAMSEITPSAEDIIFEPNFGLRGFAQLVNLDMTYWYHRESWYSKSMIVSTDFFLGNNIIEMAVKVNRNRAVC